MLVITPLDILTPEPIISVGIRVVTVKIPVCANVVLVTPDTIKLPTTSVSYTHLTLPMKRIV